MKKILFLSIFIAFMALSLPGQSSALTLGPYDGKVIDSQTGEPIEGASVLFYWQKRIFQVIESSTELIDVKLVYTDSKGQYNIPQSEAVLGMTFGMSDIFEATKVIVYQPGYVSYLESIYHEGHQKPGHSFKNNDHIIKLERIPPNFNHRNHYSSIDSALWGLREIDDLGMIYSGTNEDEELQRYLKANRLTLDSFKEKRNEMLRRDSKIVPIKEDFLRRVRWEERRGSSEDRI